MLTQVYDVDFATARNDSLVFWGLDGRTYRIKCRRRVTLDIFSHSSHVTNITWWYGRFVLEKQTGGRLEIILSRELTRKDIRSYPKEWDLHALGDRVPQFYFKEDVFRRAKQVFKRMGRGWELIGPDADAIEDDK